MFIMSQSSCFQKLCDLVLVPGFKTWRVNSRPFWWKSDKEKCCLFPWGQVFKINRKIYISLCKTLNDIYFPKLGILGSPNWFIITSCINLLVCIPIPVRLGLKSLGKLRSSVKFLFGMFKGSWNLQKCTKEKCQILSE